MDKNQEIIIAAGGTGGHVLPGLNVAQKMMEAGYQVIWIGTQHGIENRLVPNIGINLLHIDVGGIRKNNLLLRIKNSFKMLKSVVKSYKIVRKQQGNLVVVFGGYVAAPVGVAAKLARKTLVIHEQNSIPGKTNKILSYVADLILTAYPEVFAQPCVVAGNPIHPGFLKLAPPATRFAQRTDERVIFIFGGSRGAAFFNRYLPAVMVKLSKVYTLKVIHQCGVDNYQEVMDSYQDFQGNYEVKEYIDNMANFYGMADLVICRGGALTVAELCAVGVGALIIPYKHAVDDHQYLNTQILKKAEASIVVREDDFSAAGVYDILYYLLQERTVLLKMAESAYAIGKRNSLDVIYQHITRLITQQ